MRKRERKVKKDERELQFRWRSRRERATVVRNFIRVFRTFESTGSSLLYIGILVARCDPASVRARLCYSCCKRSEQRLACEHLQLFYNGSVYIEAISTAALGDQPMTFIAARLQHKLRSLIDFLSDYGYRTRRSVSLARVRVLNALTEAWLGQRVA